MKTHLMYRDRDFDLQQKLPSNESDLSQDLELNTLFRAMAEGDDFLTQVAKQAVLSGLEEEMETIVYRQAILKDCLRNEHVVKTLYAIAVEAFEDKRNRWLVITSHYPDGILYEAVESLQMLTGLLGKLKHIADQHAPAFESEGFTAFFAMIKEELADDYLACVRQHLGTLKFRKGVLMSAQLGEGNTGTNYVLRKSMAKPPGLFRRIFGQWQRAYTYWLDPRDDAGARALSELRNRGISLVANAAAQSADHTRRFFAMLRTELAFYVGCLNMHRQLALKGASVCFPVPAPLGSRRHTCVGLRDVGLVLTVAQSVVGNDLNADGKALVIITGANQGGKSTFLRAVGLAQLMMQCGMFVAAESFHAELCRELFTHYRRKEDATMERGKFDEELDRMSTIVGALRPDSMLLFNESFASTNGREGSEIAGQIIRALMERSFKVFFVTHLYEFANGVYEKGGEGCMFLRAERKPDGTRSFRIVEGEPLQTSYGEDVYRSVFGNT